MTIEVKVERHAAARSGRGGRAGEGCGLLLTRLARATNQALACALSNLGLRSQQFAILHLLAQGPASQVELAERMGVHPSNLVRLLDELESERHLARRRDPGDRRRQLVVLTDRGWDALERADEAAAQVERELLSSLNPTERRQLRALLGRLAAQSCAPSPGRSCATR